MSRALAVVVVCFFIVLSVDQYIKYIFIDGFVWHSNIISFYLVYNYGVAFSMFEFLGHYLKYIQIILITVLFLIVFMEKEFFKKNKVAIGIILGAGSSNILDRFLHGGVVDYIAWHYKFEFAIFNLADILINFGVFLIAVGFIRDWNKAKKNKSI